ncbi:acyl transferase [Hydrotalea sp.]|uniref:LuxE/PaaK family acyltransferase n=1 Tax=Hydrotalea sp. TaxID=2881279 RepID=UPI003D12DEA8
MELLNKIFSVSASSFPALANEIFQFQYDNNNVYAQWVDLTGNKNAASTEKIPFLPISFFKTKAITSTNFYPEAVFESSGTTGTINSRHLVKSVVIYEKSFLKAFEQFYGSPKNWCIIGLLPAYLERPNSSLVTMVDSLIKLSNHSQSGFYLYNYAQLASTLKALEAVKQPVLLIGVTFALLDFAEQYPQPLKHTVIIETGGMKGRRKEITREALHQTLMSAFNLPAIHAEYGMTELLSQAYSKGNGRFYCPPWMKVMVRDEDDPLQIKATGEGILNIIDLANLYSCSFIATEDVGKVYDDGSFEVLGRLDNSDIRGCSLLVT